MANTTKATILAAVDIDGEVEAAKSWLAKWRGDLTFVSDDRGCGCCIHMWDVEGPEEVLACFPCAIREAGRS